MTSTSKHETKTCPRCGRTFECKSSNPLRCDCAEIGLSEDAQMPIQDLYRDCLCVRCLRALAGTDTPSP